MPQSRSKQRPDESSSAPYTVRTLSWSKEQNEAWLNSLTALIIEMYMDAEQLQDELPLFETKK